MDFDFIMRWFESNYPNLLMIRGWRCSQVVKGTGLQNPNHRFKSDHRLRLNFLINFIYGGVAELADASDSKSGVPWDVSVRPRSPLFIQTFWQKRRELVLAFFLSKIATPFLLTL